MKTNNNSAVLADFTKIYEKGTGSVKACDKINFEAKENSITGILGLNGAGKSTMLKALCGLHNATEGTVEVCGFTEGKDIRNVCGYVPEFPELENMFTVYETLKLECELKGVEKNKIESSINEAVSVMELKKVLYKRVGTLSKGYLQRTSFAKALCGNPKVLILDEFSGGLDPAQIIELRKNIKKIAKNKTVIFSTHHIDEAQSLCDFAYIVHNGKIVANGTIEEIVAGSKKNNLEEAFMFYTKSNVSE